MKRILLAVLALLAAHRAFAQSQIITTGNNLIDPSNPLAADIVIGSDANSGIRHEASIMCGLTIVHHVSRTP